jgi:hypothetical protein
MNRRRFLATTTLAGLAPLTARAFSIVEADAEATKLYLSACAGGDVDRHRALVAEIRATMNDRSEEEIADAIAAARCPLCGCRIDDTE